MVETQNLTEYYWIQASTLGGKQKDFSWRIDEQYNLFIKRGNSGKEEIFTAESLDKIHNYVSENEWTDLANNVAKLSENEEKDGLGKFIYENIKKDNTYAQLTSQLGAIFTQVNIWIYNGEKINIKFKIASNNWKNKIRDYYLGNDINLGLINKLYSDFVQFKEDIISEIKETKVSIDELKIKINKIEDKVERLDYVKPSLEEIKMDNKKLAINLKINNDNMLKEKEKLQYTLNDINKNMRIESTTAESILRSIEIVKQDMKGIINISVKNQEEIDKMKNIG